MVDRVLLRSGTALAPPGFMRPGELAYSPQDYRLWIGDGTGTAQAVYVGGGGGGSGLTSFQGRTTAAAVLTSGDVTGALGYTPSGFDGAYSSLTGKPTLFDGTYASLTGKPTLSTVAATGAYADLTGKPTLFDGTYASLTGKPTLGGAAALSVGTTTGTVAAGDDSRITGALSATTAASTYAPLNNSNFTGTVTMSAAASVLVPTATAGDNTTKAASTAFVTAAISGLGGGGVSLAVAGTDPVPLAPGTAAVGTSAKAAREDHVHPTDTTRAPVDNPTFTTKVNLPTWVSGSSPAGAAGGLGFFSDTTHLTVHNGTGWRTVMVTSDGYSSTPAMNGTGAAGSATTQFARGDHIHPSDTSRLAVASNLSDLASAATARANLGLSAFAWDVGFDQGAVVANGTITIARKAPFACTITSLDYEVGSAGGSFTVAVQIAGVSVTGLSAVAVSSSASANAAASGANTVAAGQAITLVISSVAGSPTGANLQINGTR